MKLIAHWRRKASLISTALPWFKGRDSCVREEVSGVDKLEERPLYGYAYPNVHVRDRIQRMGNSGQVVNGDVMETSRWITRGLKRKRIKLISHCLTLQQKRANPFIPFDHSKSILQYRWSWTTYQNLSAAQQLMYFHRNILIRRKRLIRDSQHQTTRNLEHITTNTIHGPNVPTLLSTVRNCGQL